MTHISGNYHDYVNFISWIETYNQHYLKDYIHDVVYDDVEDYNIIISINDPCILNNLKNDCKLRFIQLHFLKNT